MRGHIPIASGAACSLKEMSSGKDPGAPSSTHGFIVWQGGVERGLSFAKTNKNHVISTPAAQWRDPCIHLEKRNKSAASERMPAQFN
jgi:hypothetical protein